MHIYLEFAAGTQAFFHLLSSVIVLTWETVPRLAKRYAARRR
jgi:hypothetical protein